MNTNVYSAFTLPLPPPPEAMDILKEMKEKEVVVNDANASLLFHALNNLGAKGDAASIRQLQDTIFSLGLAKPTANLCSPLITAYLHRYGRSRQSRMLPHT